MTTASPVQSTRSKARDPRTVELSARANGTFDALSSDGDTIYTVRYANGAWTCTCKGYAARETCCHSLAVRERVCFWCDSMENVTVYVNGFDGGAELALCAACLSPREAA